MPALPAGEVLRFAGTLTPTWLSAAAVLAGQPPIELTGALRIAYLGLGPAATATVAAATLPGASVWAWDPDPVAIERLRRLRDAASLPNLVVHERPVLPESSRSGPFDIIVVDGVLDVASDERRAEVLALIAATLRPGGLVAVAYRTLAGWSEIAPVARLAGALARRGPGPPEEELPAAIGTLVELRARGTGYLAERPAVSTWLSAAAADPGAAASVCLDGDLRPLSHGRIRTALERLGCRYAGAADLERPIVAIDAADVSGASGRSPFEEAVRDAVDRRPERRDLFRLGRPERTVLERQASLDALEVVVPGVGASIGGPGAVSVGSLGLAPGPDGLEALRQLLVDGSVHPSVSGPLADEAVAASSRLSAALGGGNVVVPRLGTILPASRLVDPAVRADLGVR